MKTVTCLVFLIVAASLMGAEHTLGPLVLRLPDGFRVQVSEDVLLAFIGSATKNPDAHFNIQIAELAKIRSGKISVPDGFSDLKKLLRGTKKLSGVSPHKHKTKGIEGRVTVEGHDTYAHAVVVTGQTYLVYFALVDGRGKDEARKLFEEIFAQIDEGAILHRRYARSWGWIDMPYLNDS